MTVHRTTQVEAVVALARLAKTVQQVVMERVETVLCPPLLEHQFEEQVVEVLDGTAMQLALLILHWADLVVVETVEAIQPAEETVSQTLVVAAEAMD
jgi:hypothetical protein